MAKQSGGKVIQMLTPENYIRKKARSLPIHECLINSNWEDTKLSQVSIVRRHTNGNFTSCFYLVDLFCLGVKDTHYIFNISPVEFNEYVKRMNEQMPIQSAEYALVHNIIHAGIEFAEEFGFKPHKDFTSITQFMLEEDTDDIELMEIECGDDRKPVYFRGAFDDEAKLRRIIAQLEKTAGPGNYDIVYEEDEEEDEDVEDDDFDEI